MPSFLADIDFDVYCTCGKGICNNCTERERNGSNVLDVEPCDDCLEAAREEGYKEGYAQCEKDNGL